MMATQSANFLRVNVTNGYTITPPAGTYSDGAMQEYWLTAVGGDQTISCDASIAVIQGGDTTSYTLPNSATVHVTLRYDGVKRQWQGLRMSAPW